MQNNPLIQALIDAALDGQKAVSAEPFIAHGYAVFHYGDGAIKRVEVSKNRDEFMRQWKDAGCWGSCSGFFKSHGDLK